MSKRLLQVNIELEYKDTSVANNMIGTNISFNESLFNVFPFKLGKAYKFYYMSLENRELLLDISPFGILLESGLFKEFHFTFNNFVENDISAGLKKRL